MLMLFSVHLIMYTLHSLGNGPSTKMLWFSNTPLKQSKNCLDRDPGDEPGYTGHALFNTTNRITSLFIVQSLFRRNPPNIWIKFI